MVSLENFNPTLDQLAESENLSVRSYNVCKDNGLTTLTKIISHYNNRGTFLYNRNCGAKSNAELVNLCNKHINNLNKCTQLGTENQAQLLNLDKDRLKLLEVYVNFLVSKLSIRAQNGLKNLTQSNEYKNIFNALSINSFTLSTIRNIGSKTITELQKLKFDVDQYFIFLQKLPSSKINNEYYFYYFKSFFPFVSDITIKELVVSLTNGFKIFQILEILINNNILMKEREVSFFLNEYTDIKNKLTHKYFAEKYNISLERARQIKVSLESELKIAINFIKYFYKESEYGTINFNQTFIIISRGQINEIRKDENTKFTFYFHSLVFEIILFNTHKLLKYGDGERSIFSEKCLYFIHNSFIKAFAFKGFFHKFSCLTSGRIDSNFTLDYYSLLKEFIKSNNTDCIPEIDDFCRQIIFLEYNIHIPGNGLIQVERNTKKQLSEYLIELLDDCGHKMHINDIMLGLAKKFPQNNFNENSVKVTLQSEKDVFIFIGMTSTYALKRWEEEFDNIKGGTLRSIIEDYLQGHNKPKHLTEIIIYLNSIDRFPSRNSLLSNLKVMVESKFQFFRGDFIGLKDKVYDFDDNSYKNISGSRFTVAQLSKFIGFNIDYIIDFYVTNYNYSHFQVKEILDQKSAKGLISFNEFGILEI